MRILTLGTFASLLLLIACGDKEDTASEVDADADGYTDDVDCNDRDPLIHPDANETCDGRDNDCDDEIDEGATVPLYFDADLDGYGDPDAETTGCPGTGGYSDEGTDCDDDNADVHPDADEWCDGLDNDCDDLVDEEIEYADWYADDDEDGFGDPDELVNACVQPSGYIEDGSDCDDNDPDINPNADEHCDGVDNDCDDDTDEADALDATTWYPDADSDGYGDMLADGTAACEAGSGNVEDSTDCDDQSASVNPGGTEICDDAGRDEDCDGLVDDDDDSTDTSSMTSWHPDSDGDGYGDSNSSTPACLQPSGYLADDTDCDDNDGMVNLSMAEQCDGVDNDCDGLTDDDDSAVVDSSTWYRDSDGDGYGDAGSSASACNQPTGYVSDDTDCDDTDASQTTDCSGDTGDTGGGFSRDGSYTGTFEVELDVPVFGMRETCSGTVEIEVDESAATQISGTADCIVPGLLGSMVGPLSATIEGAIASDPDVVGTMDISEGGSALFSDDWEGEFSGADTLIGTFDGTTSVLHMPAWYDGEFEVVR